MKRIGDNTKPEFRVRLRGGFSDRNNIKPENKEMQFESLDDRTRTAIINLTDMAFQELRERESYSDIQSFLRRLMSEVYALETKPSLEYVEEKVMNIFRETVRKDDYDAVFSVLEYMAREFYELSQHRLKMQKYYNALFEKEYVGYRFVDWKIVEITDENEIAAIEEGISGPYDVVNIHISKAITLLSDRDKPDYENSIKESISAVEALCEVITGVKGKEATLSKLLKKLEEDGVVIHSAMKSAFLTLYGYTSDANGIRHAGNIGGPSSTFEEAKFMLVSCSAFVNYLIAVSAK